VETKEDIRKRLRAEREALTPKEVEAKSQAIVARLLKRFDWSQITSVHCYQSIPKFNEVQTQSLWREILAMNPKIQIYTPSQDVEGLSFDLVIVPMVAFDDSLHRLGFGGGFYDRFLATQPQTKKVGLAYELSHVEQLPVQEHDVAMHMVITETEVYQSS
jgi:5-formyltetrahydrofolate cyclo-ligase